MSQFILVCGLENEVSTHQIVSYLKATNSIQNVWMDPYGNPRAVVLCDKKLELRDMKIKSNIGSTVELARYLVTARPTTSVFVKTYNSLTFGVKDKLKYLFTSQKHGGRKVLKVQQLGTKDDDCYELFFMKWEDVQKICNGTWIVEKQTLTVIPFFDSFKEPFQQQLKKLIDSSNSAKQAKRGDTHFVSQKETSVVLKSSEMSYVPNTSVKAVHHSENQGLQRAFSSSSSFSDFATDEEDRKAGSYPRTGSKDNLKSAKPVLEHPYILTLLHLLKFEFSVKQKYNLVTVTIHESDWDVEITGPVASLKIIQKLLTEEDELDHPALIETFLGNEGALQDLKTFIDSAGLFVEIVNPRGKPLLQVTDGENIKETFHDFILTLVISKECYPLPGIECQTQTEWTDFVKLFENTYTHQHIFVEDTSVTLACLASRSQEMDFMVNVINNVISKLKKGLKPGVHQDESVPNPDQTSQKSKVLNDSSQSSGNSNYVGREESSEFKKTLCFENSVLLWILNILNLKKSLRQITKELDVDIDEVEREILISGSKEMLQKLKSVLVKEYTKFQFTEAEQAHLCDPKIRESLKSCLISYGCCIVLNGSLELFVASKDGQEVQFRHFLTSFIQFKTVCHLPEKYQQTKEWNSLVENCKNKYPHHHILTADDEVILLSIAADENKMDTVSILKELKAAIAALISPGLPEKHLSFTEKVGDQKFEGLKMDNSKKSAVDKKVTLCYKHPVLLRILQRLQLREAAEKFGVCVTMSTEDEIIIEGPKKAVRSLESVLIKEDNEMPFEDEETFLADEQIQQNLDSCLKTSRAYLSLDEETLELFVVTKFGEKAKFRSFLTSFIKFKTVSDLPEKYQRTKEWNSLVEQFKNNYPHHHILTADDEVILLSIAADENKMDTVSILKELKAAIAALTSPGLPERHLSFTEKVGDQKFEGLKMDNSKKSAVDKKVTLCYKHPVLLRILQRLQLREAAEKFGVCVTMSTEDEIIIEGPKKAVRSLESVLIKEDNEMPFEDEETFLADEQIQQNLDSCLKSSRAYLSLDEETLELFVVTKFGEKAKFRSFLTSFIKFKTVSDLPEKYQQTKEWNSLIEHFKNNYPHHHILTADDEVILLSIAADENRMETVSILKELVTTITALTSAVPSEKHLSFTEDTGNQKGEGINVDLSKKAAADKKSTLKVRLCYKHPVLLRILQSLQLREAAQKFGVCVTISTEDEIIIEGPKDSVIKLESVLIKEDNEMPFEDQETFLTNEQIQQNLESCLKDSRAQLLLDDDNLELFVVTKSEEKAKFRNFLTSFIQFKILLHLPEKYQQTKEWNSLVEHFKNNYPHHHILTADGEVILLSIAADENNIEADSVRKELETAITVLTSSAVPKKHSLSTEEIGDQKGEGIKIDHSKKTTADKKSTQKVRLCYKHPVLLRILQNLQLREAAQKFGIFVTMSAEDEIIIEGPKNDVRSLESVLIKEDNEMPFEDQEEFFTFPRLRQHLDKCLKESTARLILEDEFEMFVVTKSGEKEQFRTFIKRLIRFQRCADMPEKYQNDPAWKTKLQQFQEQNPLHHILNNGEEVYLLTISSDDKSHEANLIRERINKAISESYSSLESMMSGEDECYDVIFNIPPLKISYFQLYLSHELQEIYDRWEGKSCRPDVTFKNDAIQISSSSVDVTNKTASQLKETFLRIKTLKKEYNFPGLSTYLNSEGLGLIHSLMDQYRCLFQVPEMSNLNPQHISINEEQSSGSSQGHVYKVIFLGTVNCSGFNIHLVQGNVNDLNLEMKIHLQPSEEVESCEIKGVGSTHNAIIKLPIWSAPNIVNDHSHLEKIRNSFNSVISVALAQAKHCKQNDIAFSTADLNTNGHSFPASVVAKGIIEMLVENIGSNNASSQTEKATIDIYICDPGNEAVFKAFVFFLKLRHAYLGAPSQVAWDKVSFPESYAYPDFNQFKSRGFQIEVSPSISFSLGNNACVFYPIHPSLEITSCPALKEHAYAERSLKSSLIDLQHQNPDGLLAGNIAQLKGFQDSRNSFVYTCPDWGKDSGKAIENILEKCIKKSENCEAVFIIPPGIQLQSKYPVDYLVQIFFRKLDYITQSTQLLERKKRLVLLVQDPNYKKAFDDELEKRYPKMEKQGFFKTLFSYLWSKEKEKNIPKTIIRESSVSSTPITFVGTLDVDIQNAAMHLERHLIQMMKDSSTTRRMNKQETNRFRDFLQHINSDILVKLSFKEWYKMENTSDKRKDRNPRYADKLTLSHSSLIINGLCQSYVDEFLISANLIRDTEEDTKNTKKQRTQGERTASLRSTTSTSEYSDEDTKTTKQESAQGKSTDSLKKTLNTKPVNKSERKNKKQKMDSKSSNHKSVSNAVSVQGPSYKWFWEVESDGNFQDIGNISGDLEAAYSNKQNEFQPSSKKYTFVDFTSMAVQKNKTKHGIIRMEVLEGQPLSNKKAKLDQLKENSKDFKQIMTQLESLIEKYNLQLVEVSKVEGDYLQTRFDKKCTQLKCKECSWMWHRTASKYKQCVCRYGFHPRFSGMPEAKNLGEGVLFYTKPDDCFNPEKESEKEIHLVSAKVLQGKSGPGEPGLRCPPLDKATGQCFDSVSENGACMIFSDAQACPYFVVTLKVKEI